MSEVNNAEIRAKSSFGITKYYLDVARLKSNYGKKWPMIEEMLNDDKRYGQKFGLVKGMYKEGITSVAKMVQGKEIGRMCMEKGYVNSKSLTGDVIFAYYVRKNEKHHHNEHQTLSQSSLHNTQKSHRPSNSYYSHNPFPYTSSQSLYPVPFSQHS